MTSPGTRRVRLMTLDAFYGWLLSEPGTSIAVNPTVGVKAPEVPLLPIPVIADDQLKAVLATCSGGTFVDLRDAACMGTLIAAACAAVKLCALDLGDVNLNTATLTVAGKGGKTRLVSIGGTRTSVALCCYLRVRRPRRRTRT